ncbi:uncharacterized protein [Elaeis guineensis]|uniref:uncharacterized protein n=1 Tax=Elaeis guineensis var. tenera TaxID=51953 RepID=UPI003C6D3693
MNNLDINMHMHQFIICDKCWNVQYLSQYFSAELVNLICRIPLSHGKLRMDLVYENNQHCDLCLDQLEDCAHVIIHCSFIIVIITVLKAYKSFN